MVGPLHQTSPESSRMEPPGAGDSAQDLEFQRAAPPRRRRVQPVELLAFVSGHCPSGTARTERRPCFPGRTAPAIRAGDRLASWLEGGSARRPRLPQAEGRGEYPTATGTRTHRSAMSSPSRRRARATVERWGALEAEDGRSSARSGQRGAFFLDTVRPFRPDPAKRCANCPVYFQPVPVQLDDTPPKPLAPSSATTQMPRVCGSSMRIPFRRERPTSPEAMCRCVAIARFHSDGWLDVYVVQEAFPPSDSRPRGDVFSGNRATACSRT